MISPWPNQNKMAIKIKGGSGFAVGQEGQQIVLNMYLLSLNLPI